VEANGREEEDSMRTARAICGLAICSLLSIGGCGSEVTSVATADLETGSVECVPVNEVVGAKSINYRLKKIGGLVVQRISPEVAIKYQDASGTPEKLLMMVDFPGYSGVYARFEKWEQLSSGESFPFDLPDGFVLEALRQNCGSDGLEMLLLPDDWPLPIAVSDSDSICLPNGDCIELRGMLR
jgi:hypothetical protein